MIFGTKDIKFEYTLYTNIIQYTPVKYICDYDYNIPVVMIQKAINGHVIQTVKGFNHKFIINIFDYDENDEEMLKNVTHFYPHWVSNSSQKIPVNVKTQPYYVSNINGFNALTYIIDSQTLTELEVI